MVIKVVSLNVWHGGELYPAAQKFLKDQNADVVLLQEIFNGTENYLPPRLRSLQTWLAELGYPHSDFVATLGEILPEGKIPQGNAILSRFPIVARKHLFFDRPFFDNYVSKKENYPLCPPMLQHAELKTSEGVINVFNLHGPWDLDGDNFGEGRRKMSEAVIAAVKGKTRVVLAGDSNAKSTNKAMRAIESHLRPVFGSEITTSFNLRRKDLVNFPGYATAVVDLMYVSSDVKVLAHDYPDVDVSDHLPLTATLDIG